MRSEQAVKVEKVEGQRDLGGDQGRCKENLMVEAISEALGTREGGSAYFPKMR